MLGIYIELFLGSKKIISAICWSHLEYGGGYVRAKSKVTGVCRLIAERHIWPRIAMPIDLFGG
jgi:hypothetical protein